MCPQYVTSKNRVFCRVIFGMPAVTTFCGHCILNIPVSTAIFLAGTSSRNLSLPSHFNLGFQSYHFRIAQLRHFGFPHHILCQRKGHGILKSSFLCRTRSPPLPPRP